MKEEIYMTQKLVPEAKNGLARFKNEVAWKRVENGIKELQMQFIKI